MRNAALLRSLAAAAIACCCCLPIRPSLAFQQRLSPSSSFLVVGRTPRAPHNPASSGGASARTTRTTRTTTSDGGSTTRLHEMKRPILDRLATFLFDLENERVEKSSVVDSSGRYGEPMEWAEEDSLANKLSTVVSSNGVGYMFKQAVADVVAGEYDREATSRSIREFVNGGGEEGSASGVAMYSFTTCPFCRKAKDYLEGRSIPYVSVELDLLEGNEGNEVRAELGRITGRTSVPSIFIGGEYIGGCNDGPGLLPLAREDGGKRLDDLLKNAGVQF